MILHKLGIPMLLALLLVSVAPLGAQEATREVSECEVGFRLFDHELLATEPPDLRRGGEGLVVSDLHSGTCHESEFIEKWRGESDGRHPCLTRRLPIYALLAR